jgi:hypothetical protein
VIPALQGGLVGKPYDDRVMVRILTGQNRCALSPEDDFGSIGDQRFPDAVSVYLGEEAEPGRGRPGRLQFRLKRKNT